MCVQASRSWRRHAAAAEITQRQQQPAHNPGNQIMADEKRPIIIIKKKVSHGGHHGGAWKVAYADFVTAMMALFIVLWLMNSSVQVQKVIGGYFKDPSGTSKK